MVVLKGSKEQMSVVSHRSIARRVNKGVEFVVGEVHYSSSSLHVMLDLMRVSLYVNGPTSVTLGYPPTMTCQVQEGKK